MGTCVTLFLLLQSLGAVVLNSVQSSSLLLRLLVFGYGTAKSCRLVSPTAWLAPYHTTRNG